MNFRPVINIMDPQGLIHLFNTNSRFRVKVLEYFDYKYDKPKADYLSHICPDLVRLISSFLPPKDACALGMTCKRLLETRNGPPNNVYTVKQVLSIWGYPDAPDASAPINEINVIARTCKEHVLFSTIGQIWNDRELLLAFNWTRIVSENGRFCGLHYTKPGLRREPLYVSSYVFGTLGPRLKLIVDSLLNVDEIVFDVKLGSAQKIIDMVNRPGFKIRCYVWSIEYTRLDEVIISPKDDDLCNGYFDRLHLGGIKSLTFENMDSIVGFYLTDKLECLRLVNSSEYIICLGHFSLVSLEIIDLRASRRTWAQIRLGITSKPHRVYVWKGLSNLRVLNIRDNDEQIFYVLSQIRLNNGGARVLDHIRIRFNKIDMHTIYMIRDDTLIDRKIRTKKLSVCVSGRDKDVIMKTLGLYISSLSVEVDGSEGWDWSTPKKSGAQ